MKKNYFIIFFILCVAGATQAQTLKLGFGPEIAIPTGNSANISSIGVGGYVKFEQAVAQKFSITETAELTNFFGKKFLNIRSQDLTYLPVKLGLKYFPSENFYAEGQGGLAFPVNNSGKSNFTWALGVGNFIKSRNSNAQFDFGLRYQALTSTVQKSFEDNSKTSFGYFALRVGYVLGL